MNPFQTLRPSLKEIPRSIADPAKLSDTPVARWEWVVLAGLVAISLALGLPNLAGPSLWHDELVHVFVAKSIATTAWPTLPSGNFYPSSTAYNALLALFVTIFGDGAFAVRLPSVLLGGLNTVLVYVVCRRWLGRTTALWATFFWATSPWHVGWARQARLYEFQVTSYLILLGCAWRYFSEGDARRRARWGIGAIAAYVVGLLTSFHSILYLGPVGAFAIACALRDRDIRSRFGLAIATCTFLGVLTIAWFYWNPNPVDRAAVFETGIGGRLLDQLRTDRYYYVRFLSANLSQGFFLLALLGTGMMLFRRDPRAFWVLLGFWVPVLILTYLVGYRRHRFMYFAYPVYIMLQAYGLVLLIGVVQSARKSLLHGACAVLVALFFIRLGISQYMLLRDSLNTAGGAHTTLATRHPQWAAPAAWVNVHRTDEAILTTTWLPVFYYLGQADNWFPNRYTRWEYQESGIEGLASLDELKVFLASHPRGYFLAEYSRFMQWRHHGALSDLGAEVDWVEAHMERIHEASSDDVFVWRWDFLRDGEVRIP